MSHDHHGCGCGSGGGGSCGSSGGENEQNERLKRRMDMIKKKIVVLSGKGGVGKSTISANLAVALSLKGKKVGLLDVDIHGPSIPKMMGLENKRPSDDGTQVFPLQFSDNLKVISVGFFTNQEDEALIWRGPVKYNIINQFLTDVAWDELDYLIVDCPPGTGDEPLTVVQLMNDVTGAVVVTTPQDVAMANVRRSISFCQTINIPVAGIVENMSGFVCPDCSKVTEIFKSGGAEKMAQDYMVPFLGKVPIEPSVVKSGDEGKPFMSTGSDSPTALAFDSITEKILQL